MNFRIILIAIIILIIVLIIVVLALPEFKLIEKYIPLAIGESTYNMSLGIVSVASYEVSGVPVDFGTNLGPASVDNPSSSPVNIDNSGNVDLNISVKGSEYFYHTVSPSTYYFSIGNVTWNDVNDSDTSTSLASNYAVVDTLLYGNTKDIYFWVDIPPGQYTGLYNSTLYIEATII